MWMTPPRQAAPATPPEEGNCRYGLGEFEGAGGWNFAGVTRLGEIGRCG